MPSKLLWIGNLNAINTAMDRLPITDWVQKLVGMGSDGAAVMQGKLKKKQPCVQAVHCAAHRLELTYKDALLNIPLHMEVEGWRASGWYFYLLQTIIPKPTDADPHILRIYSCLLLCRADVGGTWWIVHTYLAPLQWTELKQLCYKNPASSIPQDTPGQPCTL